MCSEHASRRGMTRVARVAPRPPTAGSHVAAKSCNLQSLATHRHAADGSVNCYPAKSRLHGLSSGIVAKLRCRQVPENASDQLGLRVHADPVEYDLEVYARGTVGNPQRLRCPAKP